MDFELTPEQKSLQEEAQAFAAAEFDPAYAMRCEQDRRYPSDLRQKAGTRGLLAVYIPREYGGRGLGLLESVLVIEAMCRKDPGLGMALSLASLGTPVTLRYGSEEQKRTILPRVAAGEIMTGIALTEPGHGSDLTDVATTATRTSSGYVVEGRKTLISNGQNARYVTLLCKTDPEARPPHRGLSLILLDTNRPGYKASDLGLKMGMRMMSTAEISLQGVKVPASNLIGMENRGFYHTLEFLNESRIEVAAQALGDAEAAFDRALARVKERRQFGKRLADLQVTQHKIADMATKIETARLLTYMAAWQSDQGGSDPVQASMAKLHAARVAVEVAEEAIQLFGGYGYFLENEVERIYRDARVTEIYEGTREIQKNTIARYLLGSWREEA
ncbi:MAG TPA: acyl-CoA dehydrogenase family protein [Chloroflexota bacterium]|nr:acyl-CoA dehydrogenase family protein [Chloroflexota bacterium]